MVSRLVIRESGRGVLAVALRCRRRLSRTFSYRPGQFVTVLMCRAELSRSLGLFRWTRDSTSLSEILALSLVPAGEGPASRSTRPEALQLRTGSLNQGCVRSETLLSPLMPQRPVLIFSEERKWARSTAHRFAALLCFLFSVLELDNCFTC